MFLRMFLRESKPVGVKGFKQRQMLPMRTFGLGKKCTWAHSCIRPSIYPSVLPRPSVCRKPLTPSLHPPRPPPQVFPVASMQLTMTTKKHLANEFRPQAFFSFNPFSPHPSNPRLLSMSSLVYTPSYPHPTLSCPLASDGAAPAAAINKCCSERLM